MWVMMGVTVKYLCCLLTGELFAMFCALALPDAVDAVDAACFVAVVVVVVVVVVVAASAAFCCWLLRLC